MQPLVGPPEKFVELWAGVNLNSQAVWSSESSKELKQKYTVDRPNQTEEMQDVIVEIWALPAVQKGRTALHMAASNGQAEIVRYIMCGARNKCECAGPVWLHIFALGCPFT
jgi:hypothetical protein